MPEWVVCMLFFWSSVTNSLCLRESMLPYASFLLPTKCHKFILVSSWLLTSFWVWIPLSLFKFVSICSDCFPTGSYSKYCVILIIFFYDNFHKDCSSNIFHKGTYPKKEEQEQTRNISLEEMLVHLANKYNKNLYQ